MPKHLLRSTGKPSIEFSNSVVWRYCCRGTKCATMVGTWAPFQYPIRRLTVISREVSKSRDLYLELSDRSDIWQAPRQQGSRSACQISKRCDNLNYQSRGFETSRDLTIRRLIGYWNGALITTWQMYWSRSSAMWNRVRRLWVVLVLILEG